MSVIARRQLHYPTASCFNCDFLITDKDPKPTVREVRKHVRATHHSVSIDSNNSWTYRWIDEPARSAP